LASKNRRKKQSKLSKVLSSSKDPARIRDAYFRLLSPSEVLQNLVNVARHPYFTPAINLTLSENYKKTYAALVPATELLLSLNWMVAVLIFNKDRLNKFVELEGLITEAILEEHYDETVSLLDEVDGICGISTWSIAIRGTVLEMADRYSEKQKYLGEIY